MKRNECSTTSTEKSKTTLPVASKIELQNVTVRRFLLLSRLASEEIRHKYELGDEWTIHHVYDTELEALGEYIFLSGKTVLREYILVAQTEPKRVVQSSNLPWIPTADDLDDSLADLG